MPARKPPPEVAPVSVNPSTVTLSAMMVITSPPDPVMIDSGTMDRVRASTPEHRRPIELSLQISGVGDDIPEWTRRSTGATPKALRDTGAVGLLSGETSRDADALLGLRETTGVSFITVSDEFSERLAPLVAELSGR